MKQHQRNIRIAKPKSDRDFKSIAYQRFRGVSLIEVLVVTGILSAMFAITVPAVQSARESTRRTQCSNRLKQLAYAVHQFESRHRYFPPAYTDSDSVNLETPQHNLIAFLLPDIEQSSLAAQYSFEFNWFESLRPTPDTANRKLAEIPIPGVKCPSTPAVELSAAADYAVCTLMSSKATSARNRLLDTHRISQRTSWISMLAPFNEQADELIRITRRHVTDGFSQSMMLFEDAGRPNFYVAGSQVFGSGKVPISGALWADTDAEFGIHDLCGESMMNCNNANEIYSFHNSGCNFAFGDSSVHFIVNNIDPEVFVSLFTRSAGDAVASSF